MVQRSLHSMPLFARLSSDQIARLADSIQVKRFAKDSVIISQVSPITFDPSFPNSSNT